MTAAVRETPYMQLVAERNELARALWAYRVIMAELEGAEAALIEHADRVFPTLPVDVRAKLGERP